METQLLEAVKLDLGIKSAAKNADISDTIAAALEDINRRGVAQSKITPNSPSIRQAVKLYCRAAYNFQGDGERYGQNYEKFANGLALDSAFKVVGK